MDLGKAQAEFDRPWKDAFDDGLRSDKELLAARGFDRTERGVPSRDSQRNIRTALAELDVRLHYDTFQNRALVQRGGDAPYLLDDATLDRLWLEVDDKFGFRPAIEFFRTVVHDAARANAYHPVRDYLDGLHWDGAPRIGTWLTTYGGAEDTPFVRAVARLVLIAAVRRVRHPGTKFDQMLVLEGEQGTGKSSALGVLAAEEDWFSDDLPLNVDGKRVIEALAGRWIVEAAELKGMRGSDVEQLKSFLSRRIDRARMSYAREVSEVPRQCVIVGTTNAAQSGS